MFCKNIHCCDVVEDIVAHVCTTERIDCKELGQMLEIPDDQGCNTCIERDINACRLDRIGDDIPKVSTRQM